MRNRLRSAVAIGLALFAGTTAFGQAAKKAGGKKAEMKAETGSGPIFEGKAMSLWLADIFSDNEKKSTKATEVMEKADKTHVVPLIEALKNKNPKVREGAAYVLGTLGE